MKACALVVTVAAAIALSPRPSYAVDIIDALKYITCFEGIDRRVMPISEGAIRFVPEGKTTENFYKITCKPEVQTSLGIYYLNENGQVVATGGVPGARAGINKAVPADQTTYDKLKADSLIRAEAVKAQDDRIAAEKAAAKAVRDELAAKEVSGPCDMPDIRLDGPGGSMEHVPVYNQDDIGICYSYAGTAAWDAYRYSHGDTRYNLKSSQIEGAVATSVGKDSDVKVLPNGNLDFFFEGGSSCKVFTHYSQKGSCERSQVPERTATTSPNKFLAGIHKYYDLTKKYQATGAADFETRVQPTAENLRSYLVNQGFDRSTVASKDQLLEALKQPSLKEFFRSVYTDSCPDARRLKVEKAATCKSHWVFNKSKEAYDQVMQALKSQFSAKIPQPLMIGYCATVLGSSGGRGYLSSVHGGCGPHASLITGVRTNKEKNKCQVLIHNSYGTSKNNAHPDWQNEGGKIWVDLGTLAPNMLDYDTISEPGSVTGDSK